MPIMNEIDITRLEARLERLIEGTFAHFFGKRGQAQDIALHLARAMEESTIPDPRNEVRGIAPDHYTIVMPKALANQLLLKQPTFQQLISEYLVELATNTGYRLNMHPVVEIVPHEDVKDAPIHITANHGRKKHTTTAVMKRVEIYPQTEAPHNPQLLIQGMPAIQLGMDVINIGRSRDNHIVIDDRTVSRYHLQLRLRFGRYTLFDTQSQSGTLINNVRVKEHNLQTGDVIQIGNTRLVYTEDRSPSDGSTQVNDPVVLE